MTTGWSVRGLRAAIRNERLSFPSQVPVFPNLHRPDIQWRIVSLYFVRGWSRCRIAERYRMTEKRVGQLLRQWMERAISRGYVDRIPAGGECLSGSVREAFAESIESGPRRACGGLRANRGRYS